MKVEKQERDETVHAITSNLEESGLHLTDQNTTPREQPQKSKTLKAQQWRETCMQPFKISLTPARLDCFASWLSTIGLDDDRH